MINKPLDLLGEEKNQLKKNIFGLEEFQIYDTLKNSDVMNDVAKSISIEMPKYHHEISNIKQKQGILFISCEPKKYEITSIGSDDKRIKKALDLKNGEIKVIHAPTELLPSTIEENAIIIGGSTLSVNDHNTWIKNLKDFIRIVSLKGIPILGICFGHQIIANSLGLEIKKNKSGLEVGVKLVDLTEEGLKDPLFSGMPKRNQFISLHGEEIVDILGTSDIQYDILANNTHSNYQSLKFNKNTWGVQFHPEMTPEIIMEIIKVIKDDLVDNGIIGGDNMSFLKLKSDIYNKRYQLSGTQLLENFQKIYLKKTY